ncbi:hypothetical protein Rhow_008047 [Rhodococcus wratislaviensis]|uniref:Uncharacterized protein n=1 Tax=Rhodococcus wratislaviensis TaxID=44752 RepID=A0A402CJM0_RHOWR|nr:hypothetical protein Rhow_008047 [Rhodococcus wratislaviensis]
MPQTQHVFSIGSGSRCDGAVSGGHAGAGVEGGADEELVDQGAGGPRAIRTAAGARSQAGPPTAPAGRWS